MLTSRGWWFIFIVLTQVALGILLADRVGPAMAIIGLSLLGWFLFELLLFQIRVHFGVPKLRFFRALTADRRVVSVVWAGQEFEVQVEIILDSRVSLPYFVVQDRPPSGCERVNGRDDRIGRITENDVVEINYVLRCPVPGEIKFEGVRVQMADHHGFFYQRAFIRQPATYLVLPPLVDAEGNRRNTKSHNILPPPGLHRLRQSGSGSELHDLRDYRAGDPPKMIAWKASARRDRLITKEFETDVPVRCTLFIDTSQSVRLGPARETMLNQITTIASGVAQAALSDRDHVGMVLFDEKKTEILKPARNSRHLIEMLHRLARANSAAPVSPSGDVGSLMQLASPLAHELYPEMMDRRVNSTPLRMFWEPILDSRKSWLMLIPLSLFIIVMGWVFALLTSFIFEDAESFKTIFNAGRPVLESLDFLGTLLTGPIIAVAFGVLAGVMWFFHGLSGQLPPWYGLRMRRKRLAALLAAIDRSPPGTEARYLDDDPFFAPRVQKFLAEHHRRYPIALFDEDGRYQFRSESKIDVLSKSLVHSIAHCRDNEMFVILADLFELEGDLASLIRAVRVASARHHHLLVICPWMPGIPIFDESLSKEARAKAMRERGLSYGFRGIQAQLFRQTSERYHLAFLALRREFGKSGIVLVRAQQHESVRLILNKMDRLRGTRARR